MDRCIIHMLLKKVYCSQNLSSRTATPEVTCPSVSFLSSFLIDFKGTVQYGVIFQSPLHFLVNKQTSFPKRYVKTFKQSNVLSLVILNQPLNMDLLKKVYNL